MDYIVPISEARSKLPELIKKISSAGKRLIITRRGRPEAVVLSEEDYESLLETIDILSDKKLLGKIKKAQDELRAGKGISWNKAKTKLGKG